MREILFRGKTEQGEWIYGYYVYKNPPLIVDTNHGSLGFGRRVLPETVGQFTGLFDKNGKKIFEGDICDLSILGGDHTLVKINVQHGCVGYEPLDYSSVHPDDREWKSFWHSDEGYLMDTKYFTIIGNIHDNPELLKLNLR